MTKSEAIELLKEYATRIKPFYEPKRTNYAQAIDLAIEALQTDIVRCKDCKNNYNTCTNHGTNQPMCDFTDRMLKETDFCSKGERK